MTRHATHAIRPAADISGTLAALEAKVDRLTTLVEQLVSAPSSGRSWVSIEEAAARVNLTPQAVRKRCRTNKIGLKVDGAWRVDLARLTNSKG